MHRGLLRGTKPTLIFLTSLTQHFFAGAAAISWQCSEFHQTRRSGFWDWPNRRNSDNPNRQSRSAQHNICGAIEGDGTSADVDRGARQSHRSVSVPRARSAAKPTVSESVGCACTDRATSSSVAPISIANTHSAKSSPALRPTRVAPSR